MESTPDLKLEMVQEDENEDNGELQLVQTDENEKVPKQHLALKPQLSIEVKEDTEIDTNKKVFISSLNLVLKSHDKKLEVAKECEKEKESEKTSRESLKPSRESLAVSEKSQSYRSKKSSTPSSSSVISSRETLDEEEPQNQEFEPVSKGDEETIPSESFLLRRKSVFGGWDRCYSKFNSSTLSCLASKEEGDGENNTKLELNLKDIREIKTGKNGFIKPVYSISVKTVQKSKIKMGFQNKDEQLKWFEFLKHFCAKDERIKEELSAEEQEENKVEGMIQENSKNEIECQREPEKTNDENNKEVATEKGDTNLVKPKKIHRQNMGISLMEIQNVNLKKASDKKSEVIDIQDESNECDANIVNEIADYKNEISIEKNDSSEDLSNYSPKSKRGSKISVIKHAESIEIAFDEPLAEFDKPLNVIDNNDTEDDISKHQDVSSDECLFKKDSDFPHVSVELKETRSDNEDELSVISNNPNIVSVTPDSNNSTPTVTPINLSIKTLNSTTLASPTLLNNDTEEVFTYSNKSENETEEIQKINVCETDIENGRDNRRLSSSGSVNESDKGRSKLKNIFRKMKSEANLIDKAIQKRKSFRKSTTSDEPERPKNSGGGMRFWQKRKSHTEQRISEDLNNQTNFEESGQYNKDLLVPASEKPNEIITSDEIDAEILNASNESILKQNSSSSLFNSNDKLMLEQIASNNCTGMSLNESFRDVITDTKEHNFDGASMLLDEKDQNIELETSNARKISENEISIHGPLSPNQIDIILSPDQKSNQDFVNSSQPVEDLENLHGKRPIYVTSLSEGSDIPLPRTNFSGERLSNTSLQSIDQKDSDVVLRQDKDHLINESFIRDVNYKRKSWGSNRNSLITPESIIVEEDEKNLDSNDEPLHKVNLKQEVLQIDAKFLQNAEEQDDYFPTYGEVQLRENNILSVHSQAKEEGARNSGINGLKEFLEQDESTVLESSPSINRLGHSVAIEKLKTEIS